MREKISATIITYNEERNIERCLKSLDFVDEIIVLDSGSFDKTRAICGSFRVSFHESDFVSHGQQKNKASSLAENNWILNIDADEVISDDLKKSILTVIESASSQSVYGFNRVTNYCGKWIYHGGWYPDQVNRLYNRKFARWSEPNLHEKLNKVGEVDIKTEKLSGDLHHYSFPDIKSHIIKNIHYAERGSFDFEAKKNRKPYFAEIIIKPFWKFIEVYVIKLGMLDGKEGFVIAINSSYSMFLKCSFGFFNPRKKE